MAILQKAPRTSDHFGTLHSTTELGTRHIFFFATSIMQQRNKVTEHQGPEKFERYLGLGV